MPEFGTGRFAVPCLIRSPYHNLLTSINYVLLRTFWEPEQRFNVIVRPPPAGEVNEPSFAWCFPRDPGDDSDPSEVIWTFQRFPVYLVDVGWRDEPEVTKRIIVRPF